MIKSLLIKFRNKILKWMGTSGDIDGLNWTPEWEKASTATIMFHWLMKEPLRKMVQIMPDIPQAWIDNLTGNQKILYDIAKECWYDCDQSNERREKLWKIWVYGLIFWHQDEAAEPFDRLLYEILNNRDRFFIQTGRLDPMNWYMDHNPGISPSPMLYDKTLITDAGRRLHISLDDPAVRFDTLTRDDVIVLLERPARGFVCLRDAEGKPLYTVINRFQYTKLPTGGYQYNIAGKTAALYEATNMANAIEGGN
ncbi:MAG: hypothetical protein WC998_08020 [Candidatus Paceibacterota bacterium]